MENEPVYVLHATAIVGCGISLFFCVLTIVTFSFFRPRTESMVIKKYLTIALCGTQVIFLIAIEGYGTKTGCRVLSVLMHFTASACFSWCALDALGIYFFHSNTSPKIRSFKFYFCVGWGIPAVVVVLTLMIGFLDVTKTNKISLYSCWSSDQVIWAFVVSSIILALVNIIILCVILKQLRLPCYDISPKAIIEKRGTRYGLRTNSLMLLGLCLGWIFAVLSFTDGNNLRYQLTFGLVNGLQGIFLFFFHCLLNPDHVKGYMSGAKGAPEESGRVSPENNRSKKNESQTSSKRKAANRTSKLENVPLISVSTSNKPDDKNTPTGTPDQQEIPQSAAQDADTQQFKDNEKIREQSQNSPDHDIIPQLPGTPDPLIEHHELVSTKMVKIEKNRDLKAGERSRNKRPKTADNQLQIYKENDNDLEKRRKSSSEPTISSGQLENTKGQGRVDREIPAKQRRSSPRPHVSINELENLFSRTDCFTKPHCSSLSSLPRREGRIPYEERHRKSSSSTDTRSTADQPTNEESTSRTPSRNTQETLL